MFLEMLRERGIEGLGIDRDPDMVAQARARGVEARAGDVRTLEDYASAFDGIHAAHVLETMWGDELVAFFSACKRALRPDGLLIVRAWNWENRAVREGTFWLELSHKRPYPLTALREALEDLGMRVVGAGYEPGGQQDVYLVARAPASPPPAKQEKSA
ncbi:MAG: class I SAM-dependent methyltransferase, partial [Candidatus Eremiobacteraeota bacterium]|nr:class I SAM-dependent methyltransferase [Candidatus Eremiobacteraeota bacterium]